MKTILKKAVAALISITLIFGAAPCASAISQSEAQGYSNYFLLQEIIDLYLETSLYETDRETLINSMLYNYLLQNPYMIGALANALLETNDPYSAYYLASDPLLRATSSSFGIIVADSSSFEENDPRKASSGVYITDVIPGSNAAFAGLLPGDKIIKLDGISVDGSTLTAVRYLLNKLPFKSKDTKSSAIHQEVTSENCSTERYMEFSKLVWDFSKEVDFVVERPLSDGTSGVFEIGVSKGVSDTKDVYLTIDKETSTAYIELIGFNTSLTAEQFKEAMTQAEDAQVKNLVIDIRSNPGGYADAAVEIASLFTEEGDLLFYTRRRNAEEEPTYSKGGIYDPEKYENILILTDSNTASAAELLAYILRTHAGATLIGDTTFGKALGQSAYTTTSGDTFTITDMEILTVDKTSYNNIGLEPDIYVPTVVEKYEFPTGLSHFNHENYVTIVPGAQNDAVLALEQRFAMLGLMRGDLVDGVYDDSTAAGIIVYRLIVAGDKNPDHLVTYEMVTKMTATINGYKNKYVEIDAAMNVANLYIKNHSQGKRLAKEYVNQMDKFEKQLKEEQSAAAKENEEEYENEQSETEDTTEEQ